MRRFAVILVALGVVLGLSLAAAVHAVTTEEVLAKMSKQRGEVKTFEFDMKTEMKGAQEGAVMNGHMCTQAVEKDGKPAMSLMNMKQSMEMNGMKNDMLMVHDGEFIWQEMRAMGRVIVMKLKPNPSASRNDPSQFADMYDLKYVGDEEFDGQKMWVLEGTPKPGAAPAPGPKGMTGPEPGKIRISVGQSDSFPHRYILYAKDGAEMAETQITNVKLNPKLDPALFKYTPPAGAQVMDMTKGGMPQMPPAE